MTTRTATANKAPDDKPFDFNLDAVQSERDLVPFRVHFGGRRFSFAHIEDLDVWRLMEGADGGDIGMTLAAFKAALGDDYAEFAKNKLPQWKMKSLFTAWKDHCGVESGESAASSDS